MEDKKEKLPSTRIQWYPGHMAKTKREISENLKLIDVVIEILDSRIPRSSQNPDIANLTKNKKKIIILNKSDLADARQNELWINKLKKDGQIGILTDCNSGKGINDVIKAIENIMKDDLEKFAVKGRTGKKIKVMILGIPNVGKSSFINTMVNRKKLARTSSEPGKTRLINFYNVNKDFYFVDLPGYGYSKMSKVQQAEVGKFIEQYLHNCKDISLIVFLIDIRHNPTKDDKMMYDYIINQNLPCIILANKADKIAVTKVDNQVKELQDILNPLKDLKFMPFSAERKIYTDDAWEEIEKYL